jgi:hypothetical protein
MTAQIKQGDPIGPISADSAICLQFFVNYRRGPKFLATFCHGKIYALILTKRGLGYILGDFSANPLGHPGQCSSCLRNSPCMKR